MTLAASVVLCDKLGFKADMTNTIAHSVIEADDATYRRFGVAANQGKLYVQYVDGSTSYYPTDILSNLQINTWYSVSIVVDDSNGFYVEACQVDNPSVRGSYHTWMPTGKNWRFHHWIWQGNAYIDDYREFSAANLDWSPKQYLAYDYDALDRLTSATPYSAAWDGYTGYYTYSTIANLTDKTENGSPWAYTYPSSGAGSIRPHAVITVTNVSSYGYDANGNMVTRTIGNDTYLLSYDVENRLKEVKRNGVVTATFGYDGDGKMVTATVGVTTTFYVGNHFEKVGTITHTYYYHAGKRIAVRKGTALYWLLTDHLGSTSMVISATQAVTGELRYREASPKRCGGDKAYGETRDGWGITTTTKYHFTGQREEGTIGLYFYNARWYDAALGRFVQADTIVRQAGDPQSLNRYSYGLNNPVKYTDPSGHAICEDEECRELTRVAPNVREKYTRAFWLMWMTMQRVAQSKALASIRAANALRSPIPGLAGTARAAGDLVFASHVRQGGAWDMKAVMREDAANRGEEDPYKAVKDSAIEVGGPKHYYDVFGNFSYGFWGRDAGYSLDYLLDKAGEAQFASDIFDTAVATITGRDRRNPPT